MNRVRFTSFPASTDEERELLTAMGGASARRTVMAIGADGRDRPLAVVVSIAVEAPFDGKADVVARLAFAGDEPAEDERLREDPWDLLDRFVRDAEAEARRKAAAAR